MTHLFDPAVVSAVLHHMNDDHRDDNVTIARAFGAPDATAVEMIGFDGDGTDWRVQTPAGERDLRIAWPAAPVTERPAVRTQVVELYLSACRALGEKPRRHEG